MPLSFVYVGPLNAGGTCLQRLEALIELGHRVTPIDTACYSSLRRPLALVARACRRFKLHPDLADVNRRVIAAGAACRHDVLWIDKGLIIAANTLEAVRACSPSIKIVSYSPDDMMNPSNQSRNYLRCISLYDLHVTTKSYNVAELKVLGARPSTRLYIAPIVSRAKILRLLKDCTVACTVGTTLLPPLAQAT